MKSISSHKLFTYSNSHNTALFPIALGSNSSSQLGHYFSSQIPKQYVFNNFALDHSAHKMRKSPVCNIKTNQVQQVYGRAKIPISISNGHSPLLSLEKDSRLIQGNLNKNHCSGSYTYIVYMFTFFASW